MTYSQKYCIVSFLQPIEVGYEYPMGEWPLHVTFANVFALNDVHTLKSGLPKLLQKHHSIHATAKEDTVFGTTDVTLLQQTEELIHLHLTVVNYLEKSGAVISSPEFIRDNFKPHVTIQKEGRVQIGEQISIRSVSLVDMFPNGNWQQRKVLLTIPLID